VPVEQALGLPLTCRNDEVALPRTASSGEGILPQVTPTILKVVLLVGGLALIFLTTTLIYSTSDLPPAKIPPKDVIRTTALVKKVTPTDAFSRVLRRDAKEWGIDRDDVALDIIRRGHPHYIEFSGDLVIEPGKPFETTHLKLTTRLEKIAVGEEGMELRTDHVVMQIENKSDRYLAYRVKTVVEGKCGSKAVFAHNAMALKPRETLSRTECLPKGPGELRLRRVEIMELRQLGYYYISRIDPERLFMDPRTTEGHQIPFDKPCKMLPWRSIHQAVKKGGAGWRDIIDYYARHNCDKYFFFPAYRYAQGGLKGLPARAEGDKAKK